MSQDERDRRLTEIITFKRTGRVVEFTDEEKKNNRKELLELIEESKNNRN